MVRPLRKGLLAPALLVSLLLSACGGGGGSTPASADQPAATPAPQQPSVPQLTDTPRNPGGSQAPSVSQETGAPQATGNTATDGFNWFNFRRQQIGLSTLSRNSLLDSAALGHSNYQKLNNVITHVQTEGNQGFTGAQIGDRLAAADYRFTNEYDGFAYGEVIASTHSTAGFDAAEDLIAAIYHRFLVFEPMYKEAGAGAATVAGGNTYFTTNFAANGLDRGLGQDKVALYPFSNQQRVPRNFFSDSETPDPVPSKNEVGYPISIHADITATVAVQSFTVRPRGGAPLPVQPLTSGADQHTPASVAAIVPLNVLAPATTYDVQFVGTVNGANINRSWSFTTQ